MTNTERIQANNAELLECIDIANELPNADSGEAEIVLQSKTVTPSESTQEIVADESYTALEKVTVEAIPSEYIVPSGTKSIAENGTHEVKAYEFAEVNVPIPDGYIVPSGVLEIATNGEHDVTEYASVNVNVPTGGGGSSDVLKTVLNRSITEFVDNEIETIGVYAFTSCSAMTKVDVPSVTTLGNYAFSSCTALTEFGGEEATSIGNYAFTGCSVLASVNLPKLKTIGQYAFQNCTALQSYDGEEVTTIGAYAFTGCSALISVNFPKATSVGGYAFNGTSFTHLSLPSLKSMTTGAFRGSKFTSIDLPIVTNISNNGFRAQGYLKSATFPKVTSTSSEAMRNCTALEYVDLPAISSFGTYTFYDCAKLKTLIIRNTSKVVAIGNVNIITNTAIKNGTGYVYVPSALVASYQAATNWSTVASQIRAIEDYTVDGTITGEFDLSKIEE